MLGICGTFMGSLALLAQQLGHRVTGCDKNVYPPMSDLLRENGIEIIEGFSADQLALNPDCFIIGNALSRGNPLVEAILNARAPYTSGPAWLSQSVLMQRWVLAVAGTHGKTTTTSLLLHLLKAGGLAPGFLVGGVPLGEQRSADLGKTDFFVIEADEYDTAFFDKRSKFVHYHPNTLILNNLEYDHADIFPDLAAIQKQCHHLMRTLPSEGLVVCPANTPSIETVLSQGCWSSVTRFAAGTDALTDSMTDQIKGPADWWAKLLSEDGTHFAVYEGQQCHGEVRWSTLGQHNVMNALAALLAARHVGIPPGLSIEALSEFAGVKRRMESLGTVQGVTVYDDFAHHPTAIKTTLAGLRAKLAAAQSAGESTGRILAIIEPRSNTMRAGHHQAQLAASAQDADAVWWFEPPNLDWDFRAAVARQNTTVHSQTQAIIDDVVRHASPGDHVVVMSNGGFEGLHRRLLDALSIGQSSVA